MAERASIAQGVQIGPEVTPGTPVSCDTKLTALGFSPSPTTNFASFAPFGQKYDSIQALIQEWSTSNIEGYPTYTEIVYPLCGVLTTPTPSTTSGVTTWTYTPEVSDADDPTTFTVERGDANIAERVSNGVINELGMNFSRTESGLSGNMFGKALETGITLTAAPTAIPLVPILPTDIDVWFDNTAAGLGTTQFLRVLSVNFSIGNRFAPLWVLNSSLTSFVTTVETKPAATVEVVLQADSVGMGFITTMRSSASKFMRLKATSDTLITAGNPYLFQLDTALKISGGGELRDQDGVYAVSFTFAIVYDATWDKALEVVVKNAVTAL